MSNGKVALCCIDSDGKELLGDFNSQSLREIWENEKFKEIRKNIWIIGQTLYLYANYALIRTE